MDSDLERLSVVQKGPPKKNDRLGAAELNPTEVLRLDLVVQETRLREDAAFTKALTAVAAAEGATAS